MDRKLIQSFYPWLAVLVFFAADHPDRPRRSTPSLQLDQTAVLRFLFVVIGLLIAFVIYYLTRASKMWEVGTREVVYMAIGAALYAIFSYLFNGTVFVVPSVSQVALRPAIAIPMFFGYRLWAGGGLLHRGGRQHVRRCPDRLRALAAVERRQRPGRPDRRHGRGCSTTKRRV